MHSVLFLITAVSHAAASLNATESTNSSLIEPPLLNSVDRCGPDFSGARCADGLCCSTHGWCGAHTEYCSLNSCLSAYGLCESSVAVPGRCALPFGSRSCTGDQCCSVFGRCGNGSSFCNQWALSEFNGDNAIQYAISGDTDTDGRYAKDEGYRCGPDFDGANCPDGLCCSQFGWCGAQEDYCSWNCLSQYGRCQSSTPVSGRCSLPFGSRSCTQEGQCCSVFGYCGIGLKYCNSKALTAYNYYAASSHSATATASSRITASTPSSVATSTYWYFATSKESHAELATAAACPAADTVTVAHSKTITVRIYQDGTITETVTMGIVTNIVTVTTTNSNSTSGAQELFNAFVSDKSFSNGAIIGALGASVFFIVVGALAAVIYRRRARILKVEPVVLSEMVVTSGISTTNGSYHNQVVANRSQRPQPSAPVLQA